MPRYRNRRRRRRRRRVPLATKRYVRAAVKRDLEKKQGTTLIGPGSGLSESLFCQEIFFTIMGAQDTARDGYVGKEVRFQNLFMNLLLEQADTHPNGDTIRVLIVETYDNYTPSVGSLAGIFTDTSYPFQSTLNRECLKRVHMDRTYRLNDPSGNNAKVRRIRKSINLRNAKIKFQTVDNAPGNINTMNRQLWFIAVSDSPVSNVVHPTCEAWFQLKYTDG